MKVKSKIAAIGAALAISAGSADAQIISFTTAGEFSGSGCAFTLLTPTFASCTATGGIELRYTFGDLQMLDTFGNAQFGYFTTEGAGPSVFNDVVFELQINQLTPTPGSASASAGVTGTVAAIQGGLTWGPVAPTAFSIGAVDYLLTTDVLTNGVRIDPPKLGGGVSDQQTIRGFVSTAVVPEPGTYALMFTGLAGLALITRRRQRSAA